MTIIQKIVKAGDLPPEWAKEFADPNTPVKVDIREASEADQDRPVRRTDRRVIRTGQLSDRQLEALRSDDDIPEHLSQYDHELEGSKT